MVGHGHAQHRQLQVAEQGVGAAAALQLLAQLLEQHRHQFHRIALLAGQLRPRRVGALADIELHQQLLAQARGAAQFTAGAIGHLAQVLLQRAQGGLQFLGAGRAVVGRMREVGAAGGALPRQQVAQRLQHLDRLAGRGFPAGRRLRLHRRGRRARQVPRQRRAAQLRQDAVLQQAFVDGGIEVGQRVDDRAIEAAQQLHLVLQRQLQRQAGVMEGLRQRVRPERQRFAFERWRADQHGHAVAQFVQHAAVPAVAARPQLVQGGGQFLFDRVEQFQLMPGRAGALGGARGRRVHLLEAARELRDEALLQRRLVHQNAFAPGKELLLIAIAVRALGLAEQLLRVLRQAGAQRRVQVLDAQRQDGFQQGLRACRPARIESGLSRSRWRQARPILSDIHDGKLARCGVRSLSRLPRACHHGQPGLRA